MSTQKLLENSTTTETGFLYPMKDVGERTFQAKVEGTGAVTATVVIEVTNFDGDTTNVLTLGTITLSGTTRATDGFASLARWGNVRARISAISGTNAKVNVNMGA